jgi:hypothetical protein
MKTYKEGDVIAVMTPQEFAMSIMATLLVTNLVGSMIGFYIAWIVKLFTI